MFQDIRQCQPSITVKDIDAMSDSAAAELCKKLRWPDTGGAPVCPYCACPVCYASHSRPVYICKSCLRHFRITTGTPFTRRKLPLRSYLIAALVCNNKDLAVCVASITRQLGIQNKSAQILAAKIQGERAGRWRAS